MLKTTLKPLKKSIPLKLVDTKVLDLFFNKNKKIVNYLLGYINNNFEHIGEPKEGKCSLSLGQCEDKNRKLEFEFKQDKRKICKNCFKNYLNRNLITNNFLMKEFPDFSRVKGYYTGALMTAEEIYFSYIAKVIDRKGEVGMLNERIEAVNPKLKKLENYWFDKRKEMIITNCDGCNKEVKTNWISPPGAEKRSSTKENPKYTKKEALCARCFRDVRNLKKTVKRKNRLINHPISFPVYKGNKLQLGDKRMYKIELKDKEIFVHLTDFGKKGYILFRTSVGDYNIDHIRKTLETDWGALGIDFDERDMRPEVYLKNKEYYFNFPYREYHKTFKREEIESMLKNKNTTIISLSFGIKKPVTLVAMKGKGRIIMTNFRNNDGEMFHTIMRKKRVKDKIKRDINYRYTDWDKIKEELAKIEKPTKQQKREIREKYTDMNKIKCSLRKVNKKVKSLMEYVDNNLQSLSHSICNAIERIGGNKVVVMRNNKFTKSSASGGVLNSWPVLTLQKFIEYKLAFKDIPVHYVKYSAVNIVECSGCGYKPKNDKNEELKVLSEKLKFKNNFQCNNRDCGRFINFYVNDGLNLINHALAYTKEDGRKAKAGS